RHPVDQGCPRRRSPPPRGQHRGHRRSLPALDQARRQHRRQLPSASQYGTGPVEHRPVGGPDHFFGHPLQFHTCDITGNGDAQALRHRVPSLPDRRQRPRRCVGLAAAAWHKLRRRYWPPTATVASSVNPAAPGAGTVTTTLPAGPGVHGVRWPLTSTCCTCPGAYRCTVTCCRGGWNPPTGVPATSVTRVVPSPAAACSSVKVVSAYSPCWYP